jgi:hypothetical protein
MTRALLALLLPLMACTPEAPATDTAPPKAPAVTDQGPARSKASSATADPRDEWQKPEELIAFMGGDISGWVIADLFADDGYFTFKLIEAGANVIAIVNDVEKFAALEARKAAMGLSDDRLIVRAVPKGDPGLYPGEADCGLIVHAFPGIKDKKAYLRQLRNGLRRPSVLFMLEWQKRPTPVGPPVNERMTAEEIMDQFLNTGFTDLSARANMLPYDVLFMMTDPMEQYIDQQ